MDPNKKILTRSDIVALLTSIAPPTEKRDEKIAAVKALNLSNSQGHGVELTLESYEQF